MAQPQTARRRLLFVAIGSLLALATVFITLASSARAAEQYGELTRFGTTGDAEGVGQLDEQRTRAIGVDPSDNSVYVVDEPEEPTQSKTILPPTQEEVEECEEEEEKSKQECEAELQEEVGVGPITRHLRLQKFAESTAGSGTYALSASARFTDVSEELEEGSTVQLETEGIAVAKEHVYLLAADARGDSLKHDNSQLQGGATVPVLTASTLYAFSTKAQAGKLVGAGTEGPNKEVLAGPGVLKAQSDKKSAEPLLSPSGITVDPDTGEVIILGHIDEAGKKTDELESTEDHYALQAVTPSGTLGKRYVDVNNKLKEGNPEEPPNSPTVASLSGNEHVYLQHGGLVEIPYSFGATDPTILSTNPPARSVERGLLASPSVGGALSASPPEGAAATSTIYGVTGVKNEAEPERLFLAGVLAVAPGGAEVGWTGGQAEVEPVKNKDNCVIEPSIYADFVRPIQVAAGSGGKFFALAPEFLLRNIPLGQKGGGGPLSGPFFPSVVEFGPNPPRPPGSIGCLEAGATTPAAEVKGKVVPETTYLSVGTEVDFSSSVKQADALKVEWEFGDGTPVETVTGDEFRATAAAHTFTKASPAEGFLVKETIHTDNLATPEIVVTGKIHIGEPPPPEAVLEGPRSPKVNETVTFKDPSPVGITSYEWVFGDGGKETTTVPSAKHAFTKAGEYKVSLTVVNAGGMKSKAVSITVMVIEKEPEPGGGGPGGGGPGGGGTQGGGTQGGGTQGGTEGGGHQGVLGNTAVHNPEAKLASTALAVSPSGAVVVNVTCPAGESSCTGTVTLRTLSAVVAEAGTARAHTSKSKAAILTLASGSFTVAGGQVRTLTLHLSSKARKLFIRSKVLRAKATIVAHDPAGVSKTVQTTVTLRVSKPHSGKH